MTWAHVCNGSDCNVCDVMRKFAKEKNLRKLNLVGPKGKRLMIGHVSRHGLLHGIDRYDWDEVQNERKLLENSKIATELAFPCENSTKDYHSQMCIITSAGIYGMR